MRKFFAVTAIIISSQLSAQQTNPIEDTTSRTMDQVTLTASKYSVKTTETGKVVTVITHADLEKAGSRDLAQVITELGGVFINGYNSNAGKEKNIYLRGAKVDYTLITIDGVPVYDASGIGSNFDIRNIPVDNIERIEILKGSQGTLYGSDAIAGVINIIMKKGSTRPLSFSGSAHYGSFQTWKATASFNGSYRLMDYELGYTHWQTNGYSEARKPANNTTVFDKDGFNQNNLHVNLGLQLSDHVRLQPFFRYNHNKAELDQDAFTDELDYTNEIKNTQTGIRSVISSGKNQLNIQYQYNHTNRNNVEDSVKSRNGFYTYNQAIYIAGEHFGEAFIVHPFQNIKLTAGADVRFSQTDYSPVQVPFPTKGYSSDSVKQTQLGVYAALNYSKNHLNIEGGGRYNHHSEYGSNAAFNFNPSFLVRERLKIFGNISSGYKTPSLYQLFSEYGNRDLKPETSLNFEGGLQFYTTDKNTTLRGTYFRRKVTDVIAFFFNPVTFSAYYINQDKQKDHGFEIDGTSKIGSHLQLRAVYSFADGEITTLQNGKDTTYFNLLRRPKSTLVFSIGSQLTKTFYANMQVTAVGKRKDIYFDPVTFTSRDITLEHYTLLNFYAEYAFEKNKLKVFADLRNLLNEDYSDIYGYNTARFNAYGGVRFKL
jgi:vitamin B12 transporter